MVKAEQPYLVSLLVFQFQMIEHFLGCLVLWILFNTVLF